MKKFEIWVEGSNETRECLCGVSNGKNFKDACINFFNIKANDERGDFDSRRMTFWGCKLFYIKRTEAKKLN